MLVGELCSFTNSADPSITGGGVCRAGARNKDPSLLISGRGMNQHEEVFTVITGGCDELRYDGNMKALNGNRG